MNIARTILNLVGSHDETYRSAPPFAPTLHVEAEEGLRHVFASNNDGFELWMGYPNEWRFHIRHEEVRRLFWWLLFRWFAQARWFGLRRPIYYWALTREVASLRRAAQPEED